MEVSPEVLEGIRGEFRELPGLKSTTAEACRLWSLKEGPRGRRCLRAGFAVRIATQRWAPTMSILSPADPCGKRGPVQP
jgi:hypothetical protein